MSPSSAGWLRLAQHVQAARGRLGLTREELADKTAARGSKVSSRTLGDIERGHRAGYNWTKLRSLEIALDWPVGTVEHILAGGDPPMPDDAPADDRDAMISDVAEAIRRDTALIEEARQHLLNQYELLRRLSPPQKSSPPRSRTRDLRAVAHDGNPEDRAEIERRAREARRRHEQEET